VNRDSITQVESRLRVGKTISNSDTSYSINSTGALKSSDQPDFGTGPPRLTRMKKIALIVGIAVLAVAVNAGWQTASCGLANRQLEEDLRDLASRNAEHIGLSAPTTDDDLRNSVVRQAKELNIVLDPNQMTVQHTVQGESSVVHLAADYTARVRLLGYWLTFRFTPSSDREPS
jgi:hypothetical protein